MVFHRALLCLHCIGNQTAHRCLLASLNSRGIPRTEPRPSSFCTSPPHTPRKRLLQHTHRGCHLDHRTEAESPWCKRNSLPCHIQRRRRIGRRSNAADLPSSSLHRCSCDSPHRPLRPSNSRGLLPRPGLQSAEELGRSAQLADVHAMTAAFRIRAARARGAAPKTSEILGTNQISGRKGPALATPPVGPRAGPTFDRTGPAAHARRAKARSRLELFLSCRTACAEIVGTPKTLKMTMNREKNVNCPPTYATTVNRT